MKQLTGIVLVILLCVPGGAIAQQVTTAAAKEQLVVYTASGGSSKGSYQAGVDWVISEFLRRQRTPEFRTKLALTGPELRLVASTGASAGNINALATALSWCVTRGEIAPQDSLLWKFWVNTGIGALMPTESPNPHQRPSEKSDAGFGIFDRTLFYEDHRNALRDFSKTHELAPTCRVPIGLTLTRQTPTTIDLFNGSRTASVQRVAAVFELRPTENALTAQAPEELIRAAAAMSAPPLSAQDRPFAARAAALGALALPPNSRSCISPSDARDLDWAFDVVVASSAFPFAFAPKTLCSESGGLLPTAELRGLFLDGGAFDNNPMGLAVGLADLRHANVEMKPPTLPDVTAIFTSGSTLRKQLAERQVRGDQPSRRGIPGFLQLVSTAIGSAREYELQAYRRQDWRDQFLGAERKVTFQSSERSAEIFGELLSGFGAFTARPFRVYDFYSGIYDGIYFVAKHHGCPKLEHCNEQKAQELARQWIGADAFNLKVDPEALEVVRWRQVLADDHVSEPVTPKGPLSPSGKVLFAIHRQIARLAADRLAVANRDCSLPNDPIGAMLCDGGFDQVVKGLAADPLLKSVLAGAECGDVQTCVVDDDFRKLIRRGKGALHDRVDQGLERLLAVERKVSTVPDQRGKVLPVKTALWIYRSKATRYRTSLRPRLFSSSARVDVSSLRATIATVAGIATPDQFMVTVNRPEAHPLQMALVYRPVMWQPKAGLYSAMVVEFNNLEQRRFQMGSRTVGVTLGSNGLRVPVLSSIELGLFRVRVFDAPEDYVTHAGLSVRLLAQKVHINARTRVGSGSGRELYVSVGLSDLNGLIYWALR